jgi:hypothetical protein
MMSHEGFEFQQRLQALKPDKNDPNHEPIKEILRKAVIE